MKIKDKRNRNKMKNEHKLVNKQKELSIYNSEHGPYKIISFINLGGDMSKIKEEYLNNKLTNLYFYKKKMHNFLFIDTGHFTDIETAYIIRCSDLVVFVVNSTIINEKVLQLVKRHLPSCIFTVLDKKYIKSCKKFVNKFLPDQKVVEVSLLFNYLCARSFSTKISARPFMIPLSIDVRSDNIYVIKGFMKKGLLTDKVIINGKYEGTVVNIKSDKIYSGSELGMTDDEKSHFKTVTNIDDTEMEVIDEEQILENDESTSSDEYYSEDEEENKYPSLIDKYKEYKGIKNIATCELPTDKYPDYYQNLIFFQDFKHVNKIIVNRKSIIADNQMVEITLKLTDSIHDNIFVMFGYYEFEDFKTIHNYSFQGKCKTGEKLLVDLGYKIIEVTPTLTKLNNNNLHKREESLDTGVISFIAPLSFDLHKILIFESNLLKETSIRTFKMVGMNLGIKDRKLYDEIVLQGLPIKIHKRSCTVKRMFYSKEEVLYFKEIGLYTKNGRSHGFIKKPLGVHGAFKAYFSHPIASNDKIYMSLYKRAFLNDY